MVSHFMYPFPTCILSHNYVFEIYVDWYTNSALIFFTAVYSTLLCGCTIIYLFASWSTFRLFSFFLYY